MQSYILYNQRHGTTICFLVCTFTGPRLPQESPNTNTVLFAASVLPRNLKEIKRQVGGFFKVCISRYLARYPTGGDLTALIRHFLRGALIYLSLSLQFTGIYLYLSYKCMSRSIFILSEPNSYASIGVKKSNLLEISSKTSQIMISKAFHNLQQIAVSFSHAPAWTEGLYIVQQA